MVKCQPTTTEVVGLNPPWPVNICRVSINIIGPCSGKGSWAGRVIFVTAGSPTGWAAPVSRECWVGGVGQRLYAHCQWGLLTGSRQRNDWHYNYIGEKKGKKPMS